MTGVQTCALPISHETIHLGLDGEFLFQEVRLDPVGFLRVDARRLERAIELAFKGVEGAVESSLRTDELAVETRITDSVSD